MKKFIIGFIIVLLAGLVLYNNGQTETYRLSGANVNLTVPNEDSTQATHADMVARFVANTTLVQAGIDTSKNTHADAVARFVANTTLVQSAKDTTTAVHARVVSETSAIDAAIVVLGDTSTVIHSRIITEAATTNGNVSAVKDTTTSIHADAIARFIANTTLVQSVKDTASVVHQEIQAIDTLLDGIRGATGVFHEQADVAIVDSVGTDGYDILDLNTASTRFVVRNLFIKLSDPGSDTCTIALEMLINNVATVVDTYAITTANYTTYHSLYSMFGLNEIYGDDIRIYADMDANKYAITGQYSFGKTNN